MKYFKRFFAVFFTLFLCVGLSIAAPAENSKNARDVQWMNDVFEKGKALYEKGDYKSAVREWDKLNPYLDQNPSFKKVIDFLKSRMNGAAPSKPAPSGEEMTQT